MPRPSLADVDLEVGRLSVVQTVIAVNHEVWIGSPKTPRGRRTVALDPGTAAAVRAHRKRQLAERLLLGVGFTDHDLVFCRPDGGPLHPERFSTLDTYGHVTEGRHAGAASLVAGIIAGTAVSTPLAPEGGDGRGQPRDLHG